MSPVKLLAIWSSVSVTPDWASPYLIDVELFSM
jgi:hypothetical protein